MDYVQIRWCCPMKFWCCGVAGRRLGDAGLQSEPETMGDLSGRSLGVQIGERSHGYALPPPSEQHQASSHAGLPCTHADQERSQDPQPSSSHRAQGELALSEIELSLERTAQAISLCFFHGCALEWALRVWRARCVMYFDEEAGMSENARGMVFFADYRILAWELRPFE